MDQDDVEGEDAAAVALQDRLLNGVTALEHLLSANIMPDDFEVNDIASCDPSEAAQCEAADDIQDRIFGLYVRAAPFFADAIASGAAAEGEYTLEMEDLHRQFLGSIEGGMDHVLGSQGWESAEAFQESLRAALVVSGGGGGAGGEEGLRLRRGESAKELLDLLEAVTRFEPWADGMSRLGRGLLDLRGS